MKEIEFTKNEVMVLWLRDCGFTFAEVSRYMGWKGKEKARQIEAKALWKLRKLIERRNKDENVVA